jgi:O-antigen ligase
VLRPRWLLLNWLGIALVNFAVYVPELSWVGLIPTYYFGGVVAYRLGVFDAGIEKSLSRARFELLGVVVIAASYVFVSTNRYYQLTGLKSSIQLVFVLYLAALMRQLSDEYFLTLRLQLRKHFPTYLVFYAVLSFAMWKVLGDDRYNGMLGAQAFAFALTLLFAFYWCGDQRGAALLCLAIVALTGSRTYVGAALLVMFLPVVMKKTAAINRIVAVTALIVFVVVGAAVLPMISSRFEMNDEFYGSFLGRLMNYWNAADHIKAAPLFGDGMGAMLMVLEDWVPDFFEYYKASGDTTIMHNEYLRILMELGVVGGALTVAYLRSILRVPSAEVRALILIVLVGSVTENTLATYSTAIITLVILTRSAVGAHRAVQA